MKNRFCLSVIFGAVWVTAIFASAKPEIPGQFSSFRPILLTFDTANQRLFAAIPSDNGHVSRLAVFSRPKKGERIPDSSFDLTGICSGLFYDVGSKTLFAANATGHELLIFDQFDPKVSVRPTRVLRKFNFPSGAYLDPAGGRLFVADAHPGSLLVYEDPKNAKGESRPDLTISGERTGLNGPFAIAADSERGILYVSNFNGVLIFNLRDLTSPPGRLPLPPGTLARGLSFDPGSHRLYIAAPMLRSFFVYDGERIEQVEIDNADGVFPFSLAIDPQNDRLYLSGTKPEVGVIEGVHGRGDKRRPEKMKRSIDWSIGWESPPPKHPPPSEAPGAVPEVL
jgi:DNA-binding beta-propeller fold protein YncE